MELNWVERMVLEHISPGAADLVEAHMVEGCRWAPARPIRGVPLRCVVCDVELLPPIPPNDPVMN